MRVTNMSASILGLACWKQTVSAFTSSLPRGSVSVRKVSKPFILNNSLRFQSSNNKGLFELFAALDEEVDPGKVEGTDLTVLKYPHPSLRAENAEITQEELDDGSIAKIAKEMFLVMYAAEGVGLAAPQVGINKRLMVYNESGDSKKWLQEIVMVNPKIVEFSNGKDVENEGCLSFPDMRGEVERPKWIKVEALNLKGRKIKKKFKGWESRIFQHEYDHLDGVVYVDRLTEEGRAEVHPKLDILAEKFGEGGAL
jgi:peptide deformylase